MLWYLVICTHVYSGTQCLPIQRMANVEQCQFVRRQYTSMGSRKIRGKCIGLKK